MLVRRHLVTVTTPEKSLNQFAIDVALVGRLEATRARMRKQDTRLTAIFYTRFFVAAPRLRHIFRDDPAAQA